MPIHAAERTRALACLLEQAECTRLRHHLEACSRLYPNGRTETITPPCGGIAALATAEPDNAVINHATGLAMNGDPVDEASIRMIEEFYFSRGLPAFIHIFPWAPRAAFQVLAARGFSVLLFISKHVRSLEDIANLEKLQMPSGVAISIMKSSEYELFVKYSTASYNGDGRPNKLHESLARLATMGPKKVIYLATINGVAAGTSVMQLFDTDSGEVVAYTSLNSTLPEFRGRGVAAALATAQLKDAKNTGCRWIYSMGEVGNKNAEIQEKLGYRLLHTLPVYAKALPTDRAN